MGFISNFRRGLNDDWEFEVAGVQVTCSHCGGTEFERSDALLDTAGTSFIGLDWANHSATVLICRNCGHIEWFYNEFGEVE